MPKFKVKGHAFVPMEVEVVVEAASQDEAMRQANQMLKKRCRDNLVPNSEDHGAAWGFDATDAELIP